MRNSSVKLLIRARPTKIAVLVLIPLLWLWLGFSFSLHEIFTVLDHVQATNQHIQALQQTLKNINLQNSLGDNSALQTQLSQIRNQLNETGGDLNYLNNEMNRFHGLVEVAKVITPFRADLETAQYLLEGGQDFIVAGDLALATGQKALDSVGNLNNFAIAGLDNPDAQGSQTAPTANDAQSGLIAPAKLDEISAGLAQVQGWLEKGIACFNRIPYHDLKADGTTAKTVDQLRAQIATLSGGLAEANQGLATVRRALGFDEPANYMVMVQDADELRANGGFAGNYILLTLWHGQMVSFLFDNIYKPDKAIAANTVLRVPNPYFDWWGLNDPSMRFNFGLRDSTSLTPDWPATTQIAQNLLYQEGVSGALTGLIALNPGFIKNILQTIGPVYVTALPDYDHEEVTAANFTERIHYHQALDEQQLGLNSLQRKKFTRYLAAEMLGAIKKLSKNKVADIGKAAFTSFDQKDLLVYLADPTAEKLIDGLGWSGRVNQSKASLGNSATADYFYFVDDNVVYNKTNGVVKQQISDSISFNLDGSTTHHTTLNYDYFGELPIYERYANFDHQVYNRFYLPQSSQLLERSGFQEQSGLVQQYGRDVWGQLLTVPAGQKRNYGFSWQTTPLVGLHQVGGSASYELVLQKQPGANFNYQVTLKPPEGLKITSIEGVLSPPTNPDGSVKLLDGLLIGDVHIKVTLTKA